MRAHIHQAIIDLDKRMAELHVAADVLAGMIAGTPARSLDSLMVQLQLVQDGIADATGGERLDEITITAALSSIVAALPKLTAGRGP